MNEFITQISSGELRFAWAWVLLCLPLPLLVRSLMRPASTDHEPALRVPYLEDFGDGSANTSSRSRVSKMLFALIWLLLVIAAARPQHVGDAVELPVSGRDLMLAIDLSGSMKTRDFTYSGQVINRLQATKLVASDFIERRVGDRIGLILFGEQAYLQSPLTFDRVTVNTFLDEAALGLAGRATAIGDAIGLALKRLRDSDAQTAEDPQDRVLILVTDGDNTAGAIQPRKAAELAQREGMKIYTIGIGSTRSMPGMGSFFSRSNVSELDEATLEHVAETTGGRYFRAHDTNELTRIYRVLDELEPVERDTRSYRPVRSLFDIPLLLAMLTAGIALTLRFAGRT